MSRLNLAANKERKKNSHEHLTLHDVCKVSLILHLKKEKKKKRTERRTNRTGVSESVPRKVKEKHKCTGFPKTLATIVYTHISRKGSGNRLVKCSRKKKKPINSHTMLHLREKKETETDNLGKSRRS